MKTALNELIQGLKKDEINSQYAMERVSIRNCIIFATSLLENEKQQIIEAHAVGRIKEVKGINTDGEEYYNETFKN